MISSFDYYKQVENPDMYLCNPDRHPICALLGENRRLVLRFNDLSELTFNISKIQGTEDNYNLVESKRLIFVEKIGWFQIETVTETVNGDQYTKEVKAQSHQYMLKNRGFVSEERVYMFYNPYDPLDEKYDSGNLAAIPSVVGQLHQQLGIRIALTTYDNTPTKDEGEWTLTYIDPVLKFKARNYGAMYEAADGADNVCRSFKKDENSNGYDFIINKVERAFEVIFEFDFLYHTIKVKTLDEITKPTDIYLSFDNIVNTLTVKENSENIVTVMSCNGSDLDIRGVNPMGTNYIVDFDYYKKLVNDDGVEYPWMSHELITALDEWKALYDELQPTFGEYAISLQAVYVSQTTFSEQIQYANLKLTDLQAARDQYISGEDEVLEGGGTIAVETVDAGQTSFKSGTDFSSKAFTDQSEVVAHINAPASTKIVDATDDEGNILEYHYEFSFGDAGTKGKVNDLIQNYYDEETGFDGVDVPLYFSDGDKRSYCKLNVASVVEAAKDDVGDTVNFSYTTGESWDTKTGYIAIDGITFKVTKTRLAGTYTISCGTWSTSFTSNIYFVYSNARYRVVASADGIVSLYRYYVSGFDRYSTYKETAGDGGWCDIWEQYINNQLVPQLEAVNKKIDSIRQQMEAISEQCNIQKFIKRKGDAIYNELENYWIEGEYTNDNIAAYDSTTMAERIDLANELMQSGEIDLAKCAQPTFEMSVDAINFIKMYEFRQFTNELALGRTITIEKSDGVYYRPALMTLEYDLDASDNFSMTFSNASRPGDTAMTFADLIKESSSSARTVSANWSNLTDYSRNKEQITRLIEEPLDRTLRAALSNLAAQSFIVDETGILGRKYDTNFDGAKGTFLPEQIRIINNTILFTKDNWETASLALGKIHYGDNGETAYGLVADVLIGNLMISKEMRIFNDSGSIYFDDSGITIRNTDGDTTFMADNNGNLYIAGYATTESQEELATSLRQEFTIADGELKSSILETLKSYATNDELDATVKEMESLIQQTAENITLSVSETLKSYTTNDELDEALGNYSTTTEMQAAINIAANAITAEVSTTYAPKESGDTTTKFGYQLLSDRFVIYNESGDILVADGDGLSVIGKITARTGEIAGLQIVQDVITDNSGNTLGMLRQLKNATDTFHIAVSENRDGQATGTEVLITDLLCDYIKANNSSNLIDLCYQGAHEEITATLSYSSSYNATTTNTGTGYNWVQSRATIRIALSGTLLIDTKISVTFGIRDANALVNFTKTDTITIPKGTSGTYTYETPYWNFYGIDWRLNFAYFSENGSSKLVFTTAEEANTMIGIHGGMIPLETDKYTFGTEDKEWEYGYFKNGYFKNLYVDGNKAAAPYQVSKSSSDVLVSDGNTPSSSKWTTSDTKATQEVLQFGKYRIICITYTGSIANDRWYVINLYGRSTSGFTVHSIQVTPRATNDSSLKGDTHAGCLNAFVLSGQLHIGCDTESSSDGFFAQVICST